MLAAPVLASLLSLAFAGASGLDPRIHALLAPEASVGELEDAERALQLFEARRFAAAAEAFEALWKSTGTARYVFNAAVARERMGHEAVAYAHLRRFLAAPGLSAEERSAGEIRLKDLLLRTTPLRVVLTPPPGGDAAGVVVILELIDKGDRPPIELDPALFGAKARPGVVEARVEAGTWRVRAQAPGARPVQEQVTVVFPDPAEVTLKLEPDAAPVEFTVGPPEAIAAGVMVRLTPAGGGEAQVISAAEALNRVEVAPGAYQVEASAPGFAVISQRAVFGPGTAPLGLVLQPAARADEGPSEKKPLNAVGITLGAVSGVTGIVGTAVMSAKARAYRIPEGAALSFLNAPGGQRRATSDALRENLQFQYASAGLLGAAASTAVSASLTTRGRQSRRDAWIEVGVGAGVALGGAVGVGLQFSAIDTRLDQHYYWLNHSINHQDLRRELKPTELDQYRHLGNLAAATLGAGTGLILGGTVKLLSRRNPARVSLMGSRLPSGAQLVFRGRF